LLFALALAAVSGEVFPSHIEGVPFVKQDREQCGPASLASVLSYYGLSVHPDSISEAVYDPRIKGTLITDLENYARRLGFRTESGQATVEQAKSFIDREMPVIVLIDLGFLLAPRPHYLVLFGYTEKGFIAHDGETASKVYDFPGFIKKWEKMGNTYLLVYK